ncbi:L,D-transpeptidase [Ancylobacter aquaticus]|uniref:L,D-transpeptidase n=1 Tax=Ancylobacter aquaticus TaxID=100 RepID=UPI00315DED6F
MATATSAPPATGLRVAAPSDAALATIAAPPAMSPPSTATPGALSAPAMSTTPPAVPSPAAFATPPAQAIAIGNPAGPLEEVLPPPPDVRVEISLSKQRMRVMVEGVERHAWPVSTARKGYRTPLGSYRPERMHKRYFSRKYDNAPMPYSIFFHKGWAIHGTNDLRRLGRPASHGCVRLHPSNAKALFAIVGQYGRANTRIVVVR